MKLLAHYTIFGDSIYHLHTFDCNENIAHTKVSVETPNTAFIQGLLIVTSDDSQDTITNLSYIINSHIHNSITKAAKEAAKYISEKGIGYSIEKPYFLLISEYPDYLVSKINK